MSGFRTIATVSAALETTIDGDTALHVAAAARNARYLDVLLELGLDPDTPNTRSQAAPIVSALMYERTRQVDRLLAAGADLARTDRTGNTPLHIAAQINDPEMVLKFLRLGAPALARNAQDLTFDVYLYMTPDRLLDRHTLEARRRVSAWLAANPHNTHSQPAGSAADHPVAAPAFASENS